MTSNSNTLSVAVMIVLLKFGNVSKPKDRKLNFIVKNLSNVLISLKLKMKIMLIRKQALESLLMKVFLLFSGDQLFLLMENYFCSLLESGIELLKAKHNIAHSSIEKTF